MPLKLNVGLSKKVGLPDYGSLGASCHVEIELESSLLQTDLDAFHRHVKNAFVACAQAVGDELARHQRPADSRPVRDAHTAAERNSAHPAASHHHPSTDHSDRATAAAPGHRASDKQLDYAHQLAGQIKGLGVRRLESLARRMHGRPLAELSSLEASGLIDLLKAIKAGDASLAGALQELPEAA